MQIFGSIEGFKLFLNEMGFNRTATTNGPISLAGAASLGKCGYGNGIAVMERISGTVLQIIWTHFVILASCYSTF